MNWATVTNSCYILYRLWIYQFFDSYLRQLYIRMYLHKVSSDDAEVRRAINVLVLCYWVGASYFSVIDLVTLLHVAFCFLYLIFTAYSLRRKCIDSFLSRNQFSNILWKYYAVSRSYAVRRWCSYIIHLFKVVAVSSYDCILIFLMCLCVSYYVEMHSCGTLFVA